MWSWHCVQQAAYLSLTAVINHVDSCVPLGLINCPFALCIAVCRTVHWLWPGLLSLVRPQWLGNGLHMTYIGEILNLVLSEELRSWLRSWPWILLAVVRPFALVLDVVVSSCVTYCSLTFGSSVKLWHRIEFMYWLFLQCCLSEAV